MSVSEISKGAGSGVEGSLTEDWIHTFQLFEGQMLHEKNFKIDKLSVQSFLK